MNLPALYGSADRGSNNAQFSYLWTIRAEYAFLFVLSVFGAVNAPGLNLRPGVLLIILLLFGLLIFRHTSEADQKWYKCRALAESIKTSAWKFAMRAHPYEDANNVAIPVRNFLNSLNKIRNDNAHIGHQLELNIKDEDQITEDMLGVRGMAPSDRLRYYVEHRIRDQRKWYQKKSVWNKKRKNVWFRIAIGLYLCAAFSFFAEDLIEFDLSSVFDPFLVLVTSSFGWLQVKRHGELAASYALTFHEIGTIQGLSTEVETEKDLADFVSRAEMAFSREHTQWAAREDFA